jgi:hypothetical protein
MPASTSAATHEYHTWRGGACRARAGPVVVRAGLDDEPQDLDGANSHGVHPGWAGGDAVLAAPLCPLSLREVTRTVC